MTAASGAGPHSGGFGFRPDIEGLRAVAVLAVVLFHAGVPGITGGFVGVDVFFVISGYLISALLVGEAERENRIDWLGFYARRTRRLLPAMLAMLLPCVIAIAVLYAPFEQRALVRSVIASLVYASNLDFAFRALNYHGDAVQTNPMLHTWSLGVEEQYYLVWPWLLAIALGLAWRRRAVGADDLWRLRLVLIGATGLSLALSIALTPLRPAWAFYLLPTRAWEFAFGALAWLLPVQAFERRVGAILQIGAALVLLLSMGIFDEALPFPGYIALLPVTATALLLRTAAFASGPVTRGLSSAPMLWIGRHSYSWYLWHWPLLVMVAILDDAPSLAERLIAAALALLLAVASYRWVEQPTRRSPRLRGRPVMTLLASAAATLAAVGLGLGWWLFAREAADQPAQRALAALSEERPSIYAEGCDPFGTAELVECRYGDAQANRTVVLLGDSHAGQLFPALHGAIETANWQLIVMTLSSCPIADVPAQQQRTLGRLYVECPQWRDKALARLTTLAPDLVVTASATAYPLAPDAWQQGTQSMLSRLTDAGHRVVQVVDAPYPGFDVPACLARADWRPTLLAPDCAATPRADAGARADAQRRAAQATGAEWFDLPALMCSDGHCPTRTDGQVRYRDDGHLSISYARSLTPQFAALLGGAVPTPYPLAP